MSTVDVKAMSAAGPPSQPSAAFGRTGARAPSGGSEPHAVGSVGATFGKVAVLMGGKSAEREVSLMSGSGVLKALQSRGVDAHAFDPAERDLSELKKKGFKRCFHSRSRPLPSSAPWPGRCTSDR